MTAGISRILTLVFTDLVGKAQVWIDGKLAGEKCTTQPETIAIELPPGENDRAVDVLIEAAPGSHAGLGGSVVVE